MTEPRKWFEFAREDQVVAEAALAKGIDNQVCFHAQQGLEKALKGFLRSRQRAVPKVHDLRELLDCCEKLDESFRVLKDACVKLDRYYIPTRYPDALPGAAPEGLPTHRDAEEALALLQQALEWIEKKLARR
ncbi:MAG: HEPN domain-containing protein [Candidatus Omnitrophica bacterium]|nr:HEPN domain-containing protein [Candidatus Omnitrophota bacterium]